MIVQFVHNNSVYFLHYPIKTPGMHVILLINMLTTCITRMKEFVKMAALTFTALYTLTEYATFFQNSLKELTVSP